MAPSQNMSPVRVDRLNFHLEGYDKARKSYLINGFKEGFSLGSRGPLVPSDPSNLTSALQHQDIVDRKLAKEIAMGRISGPHTLPPFPNLFISPLGVVPKKSEGEFRLIHHLSYPEGYSINDSIPREFCSVSYASIDEAIKIVKSVGPGCFLAKTDIQSAFRIIPVNASEHHLLGFRWRGKYYYDKCLPMGCSSSCSIFETFSSSLHWIAQQKLKANGVVHILDDFMFVDPTFYQCKQSLSKFVTLCTDLGVPLASEKTFAPATTMSFVGLEIDTIEMVVRLPEDKLVKGREVIRSISSRKKVTLRELQSAIGFLNFACAVVVPGRTFLRRLTNLTCKVTKPNHHIRINNDHRADLAMWTLFLDQFNGKCLFLDEKWITSEVLELHTDAAGSLGYGAILENRWFYGAWPAEWRNLNIAILELYPIVAATIAWAYKFQNRSILFFTDNMAVVEVINNKTSKDTKILYLLRKLVWTCLNNNIMFKAKHIPGKNNVSADLLSRLQVEEFLRVNPSAYPHPNQLPEDFLPRNLRLP